MALSKDFIEENYVKMGFSSRQIAKSTGYSQSQILNYIKKFGIKPNISGGISKYTKNEFFFNIPNVQNCYWAGFLAADGCVAKYGKNSSRILIGLQAKDLVILEFFKDALDFTGPIVVKDNVCKISINNANILTDGLKQHFNIVPAKSLILQPPNLTDLNLCLSYIIGLIDGDGYIGISRNIINLEICGTEDMMSWIGKILNIIENNRPIAIVKKHAENCYRIRYDNKRAYHILKQLQQVQTPYRLARKWDKIKEYESIQSSL